MGSIGKKLSCELSDEEIKITEDLVEELKQEILKKEQVVKTLLQVHPYQEPAYEVIKILLFDELPE